MPKLTYTVVVNSVSEYWEDEVAYLSKLQECFRIITEELSVWGYSGDEITSSGEIINEH
jgi:hypothetical protein